jgi:RimJ/RimL family protein N-acetyltransferase
VDVIETERLRLERWSQAHFEPFLRMCGEPAVMRYIGDGSVWSEERAEETHERKLALWVERGYGWRAALDRTDGGWIGIAALQPVGEGTEGVDPEEVEIGWWIEPALWGQGYATEAACPLLDEAFGRVGLERLVARIQPANLASAGVARKLGLRHDRTTQGARGEDIDIYVLARPA